jgi:hypothetical protein
MKLPGKPSLIQAEGGAVRVDPGALPLIEEQVILIQKVRGRDAEQVRQLVHSLFFIVVHGVLFQVYVTCAGDAHPLGHFLLREAQVVPTPPQTIRDTFDLLAAFSETGELIREGVSDLHCMGDEYLVDELEGEYSENT